MIHFDGHEYAGWAVIIVAGAGCFLCLVIADSAEIRRRLRQAGDLLAGAVLWCLGAWVCRGRSPGPAHPAAKAIQGCPGCDACTAELDPVAFARWERDVREGRPS